tara:strand:+ start:1700 stop:2143 length:444 start_codon:yes stop_codon:yes gene_type:complete
MDIMEKEVFVGAKKREKRTTLLCEKETRLQLESFQSKRSERFLSLSLITFSLSLCSFIFVSSERARCAVEADTINERFYSRTFSVIIDDEIIMEEEEEETLTETRTTTTIESLERDVEVRRLTTFSLSFELENALSLFLSLALSSER